MTRMLILYRSVHGQPVMTHESCEAQAPRGQRIVALHKVFDCLTHGGWFVICERATPELPFGGARFGGHRV